MQVPRSLAAPGATRNDWYFDVALAGLGLVLLHMPFLIVMSMFVWEVKSVSFFVATICGALVFLCLILRRHYPPLVSALAFILIAVQIVVLDYPAICWIIIPLTIYDMARWMSLTMARAAMICWIAVAVVAPFKWIYLAGYRSPEIITVMMLAIVASIGAILTPYSVGRRGYDTSAAHAKQQQAEEEATESMLAEQAAQQKSAEAKMRTSIARELHDVVAHSIAVMIVQAEGGLSQARKDPTRSVEALETISTTGREALSEMRKIVHTLRSDTDAPVVLGTVPSLAEVPSLVENAQATLATYGRPHNVTPTLEATVYRVVQEGLTNAMKHAGADSNPHVAMIWEDGLLTVTVTNKATGRVAVSDNHGTGLIGMAERVQANNGLLTFGPTESGGFEVCAQFPLKK